MDNSPVNSSLILYQTEDGQTRVEVQLLDETVWLTQAQMAELFSKDKRTISEHVQNIFKEGELSTDPTVRNFRIVQKEGTREVSRLEYQKYQELLKSEDISLVEQHFQHVIQEVKEIESDEMDTEINPNELSHR